MKLAFTFIAFALMALLQGCATSNIKEALSNLDRDCVRHYTGSIASGMAGVGTNATVAFTIDCQPAGTTVTTTVAKPLPPSQP
jgi:hypothetical protein